MLVFFLASCASLSPEEELRLAENQIQEINQQLDVLTDPRLQSYLDNLLQRLQAGTPGTADFQIHVVRNEAFNAFAIAGGHIYLTTGVIMGSRNLAELISILAHEMGHVEARHIAQNYRRFRNSRTTAELSGIILALLTGNPLLAGAVDMAANMGAALFITSHTQEAEREADQLAFGLMLAAGFDPRSQLTLLSRLQVASLAQQSETPFLRSHPLPAERVESARERLRDIRAFAGLQVNDEGEFQALQQYLAPLI